MSAASSWWCCTPRPQAPRPDDALRVLKLLLVELPVKSAVKLAADITGAPRNGLYQQALAWKAQDGIELT